jgi:hypothetical protein
MATPEETIIANKTSRNSAAIGMNAITPRFVRQYIDEVRGLDDEFLMLDFGAGKAAAHARKFVADGYPCLAYEFGENVDPRFHCELALMNKYDIVYASNVLNVQSSVPMLFETLDTIKSVMHETGVFFANYPNSPRKTPLTTGEMQQLLLQKFDSVERVGGTKNAPLWKIG